MLKTLLCKLNLGHHWLAALRTRTVVSVGIARDAENMIAARQVVSTPG